MPIAPALMTPAAQMGFDRSPVAIAFLDNPPAGLARIDRALPAGCAYWQHASEGHAFYTAPQDHENCPVGAFTHGVTLSPAKATELDGLIGTMVELKYLRKDEVAGIPHRTVPMQFVAYAPLAHAAFDPDAIIFRGTARQIMLVSEAARAAGLFESAAVLGRPACAMVPQSIASAGAVASVGCIGNRVYTGLGDGELYFVVPGQAAEQVLEQLGIVQAANSALEAFHRERAAAL